MAPNRNRLVLLSQNARRQQAARRGVIVPLFAITLPALLLLCCIALNIAQFRLLRTELKIAADAAAHAGGRAMSIYQNASQPIKYAQDFARLNRVGNKPVELTDDQIVFGRSSRTTNTSRYTFTALSTKDVQTNKVVPNSVGVRASGPYPVLLAAIGGRNTIDLEERSVATQGERDIILVLDKSGSMLIYKDDAGLDATLATIYTAGKITSTEYSDAKDDNNFTNNVVKELSGDMKEYAQDRSKSNTEPPKHSRYAQLQTGVKSFFNVVTKTYQTENVGLVMFSSGASLDCDLTSNYSTIENIVNSTNPTGRTAIGLGMQTAIPRVNDERRARPFATKTIIVLTDGINNVNPEPVSDATTIKNANNVTIHTITLSRGADPTPMAKVAAIGDGKHYHSDTGEDLDAIFEEIARNLPTLLTQ